MERRTEVRPEDIRYPAPTISEMLSDIPNVIEVLTEYGYTHPYLRMEVVGDIGFRISYVDTIQYSDFHISTAVARMWLWCAQNKCREIDLAPKAKPQPKILWSATGRLTSWMSGVLEPSQQLPVDVLGKDVRITISSAEEK